MVLLYHRRLWMALHRRLHQAHCASMMGFLLERQELY
jgi:hypothetical protein